MNAAKPRKCIGKNVKFTPTKKIQKWTYQCIGVGYYSTNSVAVVKNTELAITTNGGSTWKTVTISNFISNWSKSASPVWASPGDATLYLASENPTIGVIHVVKSINYGTTWVAANNGLPDTPVVKLLVYNPDTTGNTVIEGTWMGAYITRDGGSNWVKLGSNYPML